MLARQAFAQAFHELERLLLTLMSHVQVDLCGGDIGMAEQMLHSMQAGTALDHMRSKAMSQSMRRGIG